jgi:hypothetical protein
MGDVVDWILKRSGKRYDRITNNCQSFGNEFTKYLAGIGVWHTPALLSPLAVVFAAPFKFVNLLRGRSIKSNQPQSFIRLSLRWTSDIHSPPPPLLLPFSYPCPNAIVFFGTDISRKTRSRPPVCDLQTMGRLRMKIRRDGNTEGSAAPSELESGYRMETRVPNPIHIIPSINQLNEMSAVERRVMLPKSRDQN